MKRNITKTCVSGLGLLTLASCDDPMDEITSITYKRVFAPVDLKAGGLTQTSANLEWMASEGVGEYSIEVFADDSLEFEGTADMTFTATTNSYTVTGLEFDTQYSARVQAKDLENPERDSKWSKVTFRTNAPQNFNDLDDDLITDKTVTVSWFLDDVVPEVATITVTNRATGEVEVTHPLTDDEKAALTATIDGLTPETEYEINLYNSNSKECGSKVFTTIVDLSTATDILYEGDDLEATIDAAQTDAIIVLYPGTYVIGLDAAAPGNAIINKNITIKGARPTDRPVINGQFQLNDGASLTISQVILDGTNTKDQTFNYKTADMTFNLLSVENCEIKNYTKGLVYGNVACTVNEITFNRCVIHDIVCSGGDFFDFRTGRFNTANFTNSTLYNVASEGKRDFIRYDGNADATMGGGHSVINVRNCTLDNVSANGKRLLYVRYYDHEINWGNNLVTNTDAWFSDQSKTAVPTFVGNVYFGTDNLLPENVVTDPSVKGNRFSDDAGTWNVDPSYKEPGQGDFTVGNEDVIALGAGDPRWIE